MNLFNKEDDNKAKKKIVAEQIEEENYQTNPEPVIRKTKLVVETEFKNLIRQLNEFEVQIKSGKPTMSDESRRDKIPTILSLIIAADLTKVEIFEYLEAFKASNYTDEDVNLLKQKALDPKDYCFYTI